jgi:hypothetical protein
MLVTLRGTWGASMFAVAWALALSGLVHEIWNAYGTRVLSLVIYVMMGWLAVIGVKPLIAALDWSGFIWLLSGACATRSALPSTLPTTKCVTVMVCGTSSCLLAAFATTSLSCSMSFEVHVLERAVQLSAADAKGQSWNPGSPKLGSFATLHFSSSRSAL